MTINWRELFPTKLTFLIFILYMSLFIGQGIFVTASQETNNSYNYNTVTVVLLTEVLKLLVSGALYCRENNVKNMVRDVRKDSNVLMLYFVPAFLYCLYNNLAFVNLSTFDPTTYYLLLQVRVVITGILFQIIFKKYLSQRQWLSLILLTVGCMLKQLNFNSLYGDANDDSEGAAIQINHHNYSALDNHHQGNNDYIHHDKEQYQVQEYNHLKAPQDINRLHNKNMAGFDLSFSALLILVQTIFSCLAGVYNEYLLKDKGADVNIFIQNIYMYLDSIVCNAVILCLRGELVQAFSSTNLSAIFRFNVLIIIINNAAIGIVTSFFLKYMNSILKTFASALELLFTAILCYFLFSIPIYLNTALAIGVVSFAIYLYSQSPVVNLGKVRPLNSLNDVQPNKIDKRKLLDSHDDDDDTDLEMDMV